MRLAFPQGTRRPEDPALSQGSDEFAKSTTDRRFLETLTLFEIADSAGDSKIGIVLRISSATDVWNDMIDVPSAHAPLTE